MTDLAVDQKILEFIVKNIVTKPEAVEIERKVDEMGVLLSLKVHRDDMAQIIGRQGSMAKALRTILKVAGAKNKARVNLKIEEPVGGSSEVNREAEKMAEDIADDIKI